MCRLKDATAVKGQVNGLSLIEWDTQRGGNLEYREPFRQWKVCSAFLLQALHKQVDHIGHKAHLMWLAPADTPGAAANAAGEPCILLSESCKHEPTSNMYSKLSHTHAGPLLDTAKVTRRCYLCCTGPVLLSGCMEAFCVLLYDFTEMTLKPRKNIECLQSRCFRTLFQLIFLGWSRFTTQVMTPTEGGHDPD